MPCPRTKKVTWLTGGCGTVDGLSAHGLNFGVRMADRRPTEDNLLTSHHAKIALENLVA